MREKFQVDFDKDFFENISGHTIQNLQRENRVVQNTNDSKWVFKSLITYNTQIQGDFSWEDVLKYGNALISRIDVNVKLKEGFTALFMASDYGHLEVARLMIEKGAKLDLRDNNDATALYIASRNGHLEVARLLIEKGATVDLQTMHGATALI